MVQWLGLCAVTAEGQVQSLVRLLRSHKPRGEAKKKKKESHILSTADKSPQTLNPSLEIWLGIYWPIQSKRLRSVSVEMLTQIQTAPFPGLGDEEYTKCFVAKRARTSGWPADLSSRSRRQRSEGIDLLTHQWHAELTSAVLSSHLFWSDVLSVTLKLTLQELLPWAVAAGLTTDFWNLVGQEWIHKTWESKCTRKEKPGGRQFGWLETQTRNMPRENIAFGYLSGYTTWMEMLGTYLRSQVWGCEVCPLFKQKQLLHWGRVKIYVTYKRGRSIHFQSFCYFCKNNQHKIILMPKRHIFEVKNSVPLHAAAAAKSLQSCPTLCDPIDDSPPGSPVPGILQARTLEWAAISFSNAWKWKVKVKSLSRVWLSDLMDCSLPGSSVHGIFQARILEWGAIAFCSSPS